MTDYDKLAQRIVAHEIGEMWDEFGVFRLRIGDSDLLTDKEFCHDWRVAGAMLEAVGERGFKRILASFNNAAPAPLYIRLYSILRDPCATIEACLDALEVT